MKIKIKIMPIWTWNPTLYGWSFLIGFSIRPRLTKNHNPYIVLYIDLLLIRIRINIRKMET